MVPPTIFISGGVAVLQLCKEIYVRYRGVKRFRKDCEKLAHFVHRIEAFIVETEDEEDMSGPGWEQAFGALHESLLEVVKVFEVCANFGMLRSVINADDLNLKLTRISGRLMLALQLIPIQKQKAMDKRLMEVKEIQAEIRSATFVSVRAAEEQSAQLKRLMDQSKVDSSKTQEMLAQVLLLLQADPGARAVSAAAAAAGPGPCDPGGGFVPAGQSPVLRIDPAQLGAEVADLQDERKRAQRDKNILEDQYLEQVIMAISAMEDRMQQEAKQDVDVPADLRCPITYQLLRDPVILVDSHETYERAAIEEWLARANRKDPITGVELKSAALLPNVLVRKLAQEWLSAHPEYEKQQQQEDKAAAAAAAGSSVLDAAQQQQQQQQQLKDPGNKAAVAAAAVARSHKIQVEDASAGKHKQAGGDVEGNGDGPSVIFDLNPKTAAILAARATVDPAKFGLTPDSTTSSNGGGVAQEKQQAQEAYVRAVAAAAEAAAHAGGVAIPVYAAFAATSSQPGSAQPAAAASAAAAAEHAADAELNPCNSTSSVDTGRTGSSITFARPPSTTESQAGVMSPGAAADGAAWDLRTLPPTDSSGSYGWPSAPPLHPSVSGGVASAPGMEATALQQQQMQLQASQQQQQQLQASQQQQQQLQAFQQQQQLQAFQQQQQLQASQQQQMQLQASQQQQLQHASVQGSLPTSGVDVARQLGAVGNATFSSASSQDRAAAAAAAAAAIGQQHSGMDLDRLHATLGRATGTRYRMAVRRGDAEGAEAVLTTQQQLQQDRMQQKEKAYLQQHVDQLMRERARTPSAPTQQQQHVQLPPILVPNGSGRVSDLPSPYANQSRITDGDLPADQHSLPPRYQHQHSCSDSDSRLAGAVLHQGSMDAAAAAAALRRSQSAQDGRHAAPQPQQQQVSPTISPQPSNCGSTQSKKGLLSGFSLARSSRKKGSGGDAASVADDAASVSSAGSGSSRRSVGKSMMGMFKNLQYTMVYEDDKC